MRIGELSRKSGFSVDTLRYYEKIGLMPRAYRDSGGRRLFEPADLRWLTFLRRLKETGMGIQERLRFAVLRERGEDTMAERKEMLEDHREVVAQQIESLQQTLQLLDDKITYYQKEVDRQS
ncbi:MerR family transcriptional regulator [Pseudovibrio denitrificans]|uniref:MerR family transcriptional regulator n=1 Tax=Pseudovibrio denitrificans TaxID=258256 RepID=UPI0039BF12AC